MIRRDRVYDPHTRRWYKAGYSPAELMRPIEGICAACGSDATLYPSGLYCPTCSEPSVLPILDRLMERTRVAAGYMPIAEGG